VVIPHYMPTSNRPGVMSVTQLNPDTAMAQQKEPVDMASRPDSIYYTEFEDDESDIEQTSLQSSNLSVSIVGLSRTTCPLTCSRLIVVEEVTLPSRRTMKSLHHSQRRTSHSKFSSNLSKVRLALTYFASRKIQPNSNSMLLFRCLR